MMFATARAALGLPACTATALYVKTDPLGILATTVRTLVLNAESDTEELLFFGRVVDL
jgi:hypothetical protein